MSIYEIDQAIESLIDPETGEISDIDELNRLTAERSEIEAVASSVINEEKLALVINGKTLGSLETNAQQIKDAIASALPYYDISYYNESNIDVAKKDRATLNKVSKSLNDKRIEIEKEFMQPFAVFKLTVADTIKLIAECSSKIDVVVKQSEQNDKALKKSTVQKIWDSFQFPLVPLSKVFDEKWLNKNVTPKTIRAAMSAKIDKIKDDIITIEAIGEDIDLLKSIYLDTLNLNSTVQYAKTLKGNKERVQLEAEERLRLEAEQKERVQREVEERLMRESERKIEETPEPPVTRTDYCYNPSLAKPPIITQTFIISGTQSQLDALTRYLDVNGVEYGVEI